MKTSLALIASAGVFKVTPLIQSSLIISVSGADVYAKFGYYLLFAFMASTLFTVGVVPAYIRNFTEQETNKETPVGATVSALRQFVLFGFFGLILIVSSANLFGFFDNRSVYVALILSLSIGLNSMLVPILNIRGVWKSVVWGASVYLLSTAGFAIVQPYVSSDMFLILFCLPPAGLACFLIFIYARHVTISDELGIWPLKRTQITAAAHDIMPVFAPNVFWMIMLFLFSHRVSEWAPQPEIFSWYAIGLQLFGVFVFIPNTLAPVFLRQMVRTQTDNTYAYTLQLTFTLIGSSALFLLVLWGVDSQTNLFTFSQEI